MELIRRTPLRSSESRQSLNVEPKASTKRDNADSGDTLIEILIAITILSLTAVALLGAFAADLTGAAEYKNTSAIETILKNFAEDATYEIQYQTYPGPLFASCATLTGSATSGSSNIEYNGSGTPFAYLPPTGFTITVTGIQYLYQNTTFGSSCDSGQLEPQLISIKATGPHGANGTLSFVVASFSPEIYVQPS